MWLAHVDRMMALFAMALASVAAAVKC